MGSPIYIVLYNFNMAWYYVGIAFGSLIIVLGLAWAIYKSIKNREFKRMLKRIGQKAEEQINADIKVWAKKTKNTFLPASLYAYNQNMVFETDGILITSKALIVVEIKSVKGGIRGDAKAQTWEKLMGENVHTISNPIIQNEKHIEHIVDMTKIKVPTISLIIYSNRANFLDISNIPSHVVVARHANLFEMLDKIEDALPVKMNDYEMKTLVGKIKSFRTNKKADIDLHNSITRKGK